MKTGISVSLVLAISISMVLLNTTTLFAGAWTMEKGKSYHRLAANYYLSEDEYDHNGNSRSMAWDGEFTDFNLSYYAEYGVTDKLTVLTSLYYKVIEKEDNYFEYDTYGMGDMDLGLRLLLHSGDIGVFSVQGLLKIPEFYDEDDDLPLGNGQYDYEFRFMYGRSLWPWIPGYMNLEAAYRFRAEDPADEFRYLVEAGSDLGKNFYFRAKLDAIIGIGNGNDGTDAFGNPTNTLEYDLAKIDMTIGYQMTRRFGIELGYAPAVWGESTAKGETWTLAITFQPKR